MLMMMLAEDNYNPPEFNRKRKLTANQLGLPVAKHECLGHHHKSYPQPSQVEDITTPVKSTTDNNRIMSDHESGNDCNSFINNVDSSDCTMSLSESKFKKSEVSMMCPSRTSPASTLSLNWSSESCNDLQCSSDNATSSAGDYYDQFQECDEDQINHYSKYNDCPVGDDEDLDSDLYENSVNSHVYLLSSGRLTVKQDAQSGTRGPTIDQEFEQYFAGLMLH
ncbi:Protein FAR-RED ELONGATED HYPOCOTYL 1 [Linum grandiflorum]